MLRAFAGDDSSAPSVMVLRAVGSISMGEGASLFGEEGITEKALRAPGQDRDRRSDAVRAVRAPDRFPGRQRARERLALALAHEAAREKANRRKRGRTWPRAVATTSRLRGTRFSPNQRASLGRSASSEARSASGMRSKARRRPRGDVPCKEGRRVGQSTRPATSRPSSRGTTQRAPRVLASMQEAASTSSSSTGSPKVERPRWTRFGRPQKAASSAASRGKSASWSRRCPRRSRSRGAAREGARESPERRFRARVFPTAPRTRRLALAAGRLRQRGAELRSDEARSAQPVGQVAPRQRRSGGDRLCGKPAPLATRERSACALPFALIVR